MIATAALPPAARSAEALAAEVGGHAHAAADELRGLARRLDAVGAAAAGAEAREARDAGARAWLREILDALYELGDARDDFRRAADAAARPRRQQEEGRRSVWPSSNLSIPLMNCEFEKCYSQMNLGI